MASSLLLRTRLASVVSAGSPAARAQGAASIDNQCAADVKAA